MEFTVKEVSNEEKSVQEIEADLLRQKEEKDAAAAAAVAAKAPETDPEPPKHVDTDEPEELSEEKVISFLRKKYGEDINSLDDLKPGAKDGNEIPEDVKAFLKYKKETGRSFDDYAKLNRDLSKESPDKLLKEYYSQTESDLDSEEVDYLMERFNYDEDVDESSSIKKKQIEKKKELSKAKKYFEDQKEKYSAPVESTGGLSQKEKENLEAYEKLISSSSTNEERAKDKSKWFQERTNEFFGEKFKGFEFSVGENEVVPYLPADKSQLIKDQSNIQNFLSKFLDGDGKLKDAPGYHKALAIAMDPDRFARHFFEQGVSKTVKESSMRDKNISFRTTPEVTNKSGLQIKSVSDDGGSGLKIKIGRR